MKKTLLLMERKCVKESKSAKGVCGMQRSAVLPSVTQVKRWNVFD